MAGFKRAALKSTNSQQPQQQQQQTGKFSPKSTIATDLTLELDSTLNTLILSPDVESLPLKDSFDNLLRETEAALESPPEVRDHINNNGVHGNHNGVHNNNNGVNVSITTTPVRPFNISSFHVT